MSLEDESLAQAVDGEQDGDTRYLIELFEQSGLFFTLIYSVHNCRPYDGGHAP